MQLFESGPCTLLDGAACLVLSSRQLTSVCCLWLGQSSSLSTTRIFQKCIETVHSGKCDFIVSKTLDMVIKGLNMCCSFFWQQWFFFYCTFEAEQNEVSTGFSEWFGFDFHLEDYCFFTDNKKKTHKNNCFSGFLTITCASPRPTSLGACLKYTPQENSLFRQKGVLRSLFVLACKTIYLIKSSLIAGLRQSKFALLSAPAACHAPKSSLLAKQREPEDPDPARCWCSQIDEAPSRAAPWDGTARCRGKDGTSTFDSNIKLRNHVFRFAGN